MCELAEIAEERGKSSNYIQNNFIFRKYVNSVTSNEIPDAPLRPEIKDEIKYCFEFLIKTEFYLILYCFAKRNKEYVFL